MNLDKNVLGFVDAVTDQLHKYILHPDFKEKILTSLAKSWRFQVNSNANAQIETETKQWEERHIPKIYNEIIVKTLNRKLQNICGPLAKSLLKGFKMPSDLGKKILKGVFFSALSIVGGCVVGVILAEPPVAVGVASAGVVVTGLINLGYVSDFKTVCEKAVDGGIKILSKKQIKQKVKEKYYEVLKESVKEALKTMKIEIDKHENKLEQTNTENTDNSSKLAIFMSLDDLVFKSKQQYERLKICVSLQE